MQDEEGRRLELAFAICHAGEIIDADGVTEYGEFKLFGAMFPRPLLRQHGFLDEQGAFTEALRVAFGRAKERLPGALSEAEKLDLLALLWGTGVADDDLDQREADVIRKAAGELGVSYDAVVAHARALS